MTKFKDFAPCIGFLGSQLNIYNLIYHDSID